MVDVIITYISQITKLLCKPVYHVIKPIEMDQNVIKGDDGYLLDIEEGQFTKHQSNLSGSLREYIYNENLTPKYFLFLLTSCNAL